MLIADFQGNSNGRTHGRCSESRTDEPNELHVGVSMNGSLHTDTRALLSALTYSATGCSCAKHLSCPIVEGKLRWVRRCVQQAEHQGLYRMEFVGHHLLKVSGC